MQTRGGSRSMTEVLESRTGVGPNCKQDHMPKKMVRLTSTAEEASLEDAGTWGWTDLRSRLDPRRQGSGVHFFKLLFQMETKAER